MKASIHFMSIPCHSFIFSTAPQIWQKPQRNKLPPVPRCQHIPCLADGGCVSPLWRVTFGRVALLICCWQWVGDWGSWECGMLVLLFSHTVVLWCTFCIICKKLLKHRSPFHVVSHYLTKPWARKIKTGWPKKLHACIHNLIHMAKLILNRFKPWFFTMSFFSLTCRLVSTSSFLPLSSRVSAACSCWYDPTTSARRSRSQCSSSYFKSRIFN